MVPGWWFWFWHSPLGWLIRWTAILAVFMTVVTVVIAFLPLVLISAALAGAVWLGIAVWRWRQARY